MKDQQRYLEPFGIIAESDWNDWTWQLKNSFVRIGAVSDVLCDTPSQRKELEAAAKRYPFRLTPYYFSLIEVANRKDPQRLQCIPDLQEIQFSLGGVADPLREGRHMPVSGLIHRYPDRCLILLTNQCAVYCRHCNRKRLWGSKQHTDKPEFEAMFGYIREEKAIREVILSGGDPLMLDDDTLTSILESLRAIPHVEVLRIGSRMPVVMPMRVTRQLCMRLRRYRPLWFNTQFNHPREITADAAMACEMLISSGIPVSNQSVLLRGVNDSFEVMRELLYGLHRISVRPYYLFQCDPIQGTDHFRTDIRKGIDIMEKIRCQMSGLCTPRYVIDLPGNQGKLPLQASLSEEMDHDDRARPYFDKGVLTG